MSRRLGGFLLVVALLAAACATEEEDVAETDEPIIIGAAVSLSGPAASFDEPPLDAKRLAIEDINEAGGVLGRPLELITADIRTSAEDARPAAVDLLGRGADVIITASDFDLGSGAALAAQEENVLALSPGCGAVQCGPLGVGSHFFTFGHAGRSEGAAMAEFAVQEKGLNTVWVLQDTEQLFYQEVQTGFIDRFEELGGDIVGHETFESADPTISTQIRRLSGIDPPPDFLLIAAFPSGGSAAMRQLRAAGFEQPIMSTNSYDGDFWKDAVPNLSNFFYSNYASMYGDDPEEEVNEFFERFIDRFGQPDNSILVTGYSAIQAFALAAEQAGSLDGDALVEALESMDNMDLMVGPTTFTSELHIDLTRRLKIMEVENGDSKFLMYWDLSEPPTMEGLE